MAVWQTVFPLQELQAGRPGLVKANNLLMTRLMGKFDDKWRGPFEVEEKRGKLAYKLKLLPHWWVHLTFNEGILKPYELPHYMCQEKPLPLLPDVVNQDLEYEVDQILDSKMVRGELKYLVKWKGYKNEENSL
jgi:hypothetical protein